jgi:hypothetical protein
MEQIIVRTTEGGRHLGVRGSQGFTRMDGIRCRPYRRGTSRVSAIADVTLRRTSRAEEIGRGSRNLRSVGGRSLPRLGMTSHRRSCDFDLTQSTLNIKNGHDV